MAVLMADVLTAMHARDMRATVGRLDSMMKKNGEITAVAPNEERERILSRLKVVVIGPWYSSCPGLGVVDAAVGRRSVVESGCHRSPMRGRSAIEDRVEERNRRDLKKGRGSICEVKQEYTIG